MTTTDQCRIDPSRPCGACSAPGPDQCPYNYLLADMFTHVEPDEPGPLDVAPDPEPLAVHRAATPEGAPA